MQGHQFGGAWTEIKLDVLGQYLNFYSTALKKQNFKLLYIDAFAGSGERTEITPAAPILNEPETKNEFAGSAKIALQTEPPFDRYLFIETNRKRLSDLENLKEKHGDKYIVIKSEDANVALQNVMAKPIWGKKSDYRGVIFLDPYGLQVEWKTLEAIAATKAFDVWYLFPLNGVSRQLCHDKNKIDNHKRASLNRIFGDNSWETAAYREDSSSLDLFDDQASIERIGIKQIETWTKEKLRTCFSHVSAPMTLYKGNIPYFSLFFCVSNPEPKAIGLATKAANHILKSK